MNRVDVKKSRLQPAVRVLMGIIMVPLGVASLGMGVSDGFNVVQTGIGVLMLATVAAVFWLGHRADARSVRYFSEQGLERNDGQWLPWSDLQKVVYQVRDVSGEKSLWRTEIWFSNDRSAWVLPLRVGNPAEVGDLVSGLPCEHTEEKV